MTLHPIRTLSCLAALAALATGCAQPGGGHLHGAHGAAPAADARQLVTFPDEMRQHTLANMRDHLLALAQIQEALATGAHERAAQVAEQRLGMSSLQLHNAHEASRHMPQGMQEIGTSMHRHASRFALEVANSAATGRLEPALAALARTTQACVACHSAYRLQ